MIEIIKNERIKKVLIGLPISLEGGENQNTKDVRIFGQALERGTGIAVEYIDERFTSAEADRFSGGVASRDEKAAMVMLQAYMDRKM